MKEEKICLLCREARFIDTKKEICWKTGGLWCGKLERIVGKFDPCHVPAAAGKSPKRTGKKKRP